MDLEYRGAISAILFNIPGTPSAVATLLDGYPMAQQGQPMRALAIATFGSAIGGVLSVLALLLVAPVLAEFSLRFGPPEFFLLAVFGITVIASLSAGATRKALLDTIASLGKGDPLAVEYQRKLYSLLY